MYDSRLSSDAFASAISATVGIRTRPEETTFYKRELYLLLWVHWYMYDTRIHCTQRWNGYTSTGKLANNRHTTANDDTQARGKTTAAENRCDKIHRHNNNLRRKRNSHDQRMKVSQMHASEQNE